MAKPDNNKNYYAMKAPDDMNVSDSQNGGKWKSNAQQHVISKATLEGGSANETVKCNTSVQVDVTGTMADQIKTGDVILSLNGFGLGEGVETVDLYSITSAEGDTKTFTSQEAITLTNDANSQDLKADLYLVNKTDPQNDLASKQLIVKITPQATCEIAKETD